MKPIIARGVHASLIAIKVVSYIVAAILVGTVAELTLMQAARMVV